MSVEALIYILYVAPAMIGLTLFVQEGRRLSRLKLQRERCTVAKTSTSSGDGAGDGGVMCEAHQMPDRELRRSP